jgi:hypothetical protein
LTPSAHEALGQWPPAEVYQPSPRAMPERLEDPWYDAFHQVRRVRDKGDIKWRGEFVFNGEALVGELIGLAESRERRPRRAFLRPRFGPPRLQTKNCRPSARFKMSSISPVEQ